MIQPQYRLHWRKADGTVCRGQPLPKASAEAWLANARLNTPAVAYWLEPATVAMREAA